MEHISGGGLFVSEHGHAPDERVDIGTRLFITAYFVPLGLGALLTIVGFGQTGSLWLALAGFGNLILLTWLASGLYEGKKSFEQIVWAAGALFLVAAIAAFAVGRGSLLASHFAFQLLMPVLFAGAVALAPVRAFFRAARGETQPIVPPRESLLAEGVLRSEAQEAAQAYARGLTLVAVLLLACAGVAIVSGVLGLTPARISMIIVGLLAAPPALVLFTLATNWNYFATVRGPEKAHLANIIRDTRNAVNCIIAAAVLIALIAFLTR